MARDIPVGNGNVLAAFDKNYTLREFYFPHIGEENHTQGEPFRLGFWANPVREAKFSNGVNGRFSWVGDGWQIQQAYLDDTLVTNVRLENKTLGLKITGNDLVDFQENIYLKKLTISNVSDQAQEIRIFFCQDFHIYGTDIGDTAAYRPEFKGLLHYKSERYFFISAWTNDRYGVDQFAAGNKEHNNLQGAWKDAEDGILSLNPIAQGSVDSVVALHLRLEAQGTGECFYWICAGENWQEVARLNDIVMQLSPQELLDRTINYWKLWIDKEELNYDLIPTDIAGLYKRSLLILRTQIDNNGAIIAGNDSDVLYFNRDTYSYMWPRDAALTAYALDLSGYSGLSRNFFSLCAKLVDKEGYFLHKYTPRGSIASTWHPWLKDNKPQLPIQEDETALVIWALWNHYNLVRDIEFIKPLYKGLIKNAADFMLLYRDTKTKLPLPSYDLWEEQQAVFTFTAATVYAGLIAARNFAACFGEMDIARQYGQGAAQIKDAMDKYLYLEKEQRFAKSVYLKENGRVEADKAIDASVFSVFAFGAYKPDDERVASTMRQVYSRLWCNTPIGGLSRHEDDTYYRVSDKVCGNPWPVSTLWLAQYYIAKAINRQELEEALVILRWACKHALPSGVLAEQINPKDGSPVSVAPLTWSHAAFVISVQEYINRLLEIEKCTACNQSKYSKKRKEGPDKY